MGVTPLSENEISALLIQLQTEWLGKDYDVLKKNSCTFSNTFCQRLRVGEIPSWVLTLAVVSEKLVDGAPASPREHIADEIDDIPSMRSLAKDALLETHHDASLAVLLEQQAVQFDKSQIDDMQALRLHAKADLIDANLDENLAATLTTVAKKTASEHRRTSLLDVVGEYTNRIVVKAASRLPQTFANFEKQTNREDKEAQDDSDDKADKGDNEDKEGKEEISDSKFKVFVDKNIDSNKLMNKNNDELGNEKDNEKKEIENHLNNDHSKLKHLEKGV